VLHELSRHALATERPVDTHIKNVTAYRAHIQVRTAGDATTINGFVALAGEKEI